MMVRMFAASAVAVLLVLGLAAQAQESPKEVAGATTVDAAAAKALFDRGVKFVDARSDKFWRLGHIPGAVMLYRKGLSEESLLEVAGKNDEVAFYCGGPG